MSNTASADVVVAAGAVCWRVVDGEVRVLLVHRAAQADVSLPKGKVDPGEITPQTAVREIHEETGLRVALGVSLGSIEYTLNGGRPKIVHYWAAEVTDDAHADSHFSPNQEIASLEWLTIDAARTALSYERDRDVLDRFALLVNTGRHRTFALIAVRHGKTLPLDNWDGPDATRPLLQRGLEQAESIAPAIAAFGPTKLVSSSADRCLGTLVPVSRLIGVCVSATDDISQDAYENNSARVSKVVRKRLEKKVTSVLCSHGPVLPAIMGAVATATGSNLNATLRLAGQLSTGEFSVLHFSLDHPESGIVGVETHSPLPRR